MDLPTSSVETLGVSPQSSPGLITLAALKKFNLLEDRGTGENRRVRLSDLARRILLDERDVSPEREQAIKEAALSPNIHAKLWNYYEGKLPSDEKLRYKLRMEEGFTDSATNEFIAQFKRTIEFSRLSQTEYMSKCEESQESLAQDGERLYQNEARFTPPPRTSKIGTKMINIPIPLPEGTGTVTIPETMSAKSWKRLETILNAYRPEEAKINNEKQD